MRQPLTLWCTALFILLGFGQALPAAIIVCANARMYTYSLNDSRQFGRLFSWGVGKVLFNYVVHAIEPQCHERGRGVFELFQQLVITGTAYVMCACHVENSHRDTQTTQIIGIIVRMRHMCMSRGQPVYRPVITNCVWQFIAMCVHYNYRRAKHVIRTHCKHIKLSMMQYRRYHHRTFFDEAHVLPICQFRAFNRFQNWLIVAVC